MTSNVLNVRTIGRWSELPPISTMAWKIRSSLIRFSEIRNLSSHFETTCSPPLLFLHEGTNFIGARSIKPFFSKRWLKRGHRALTLAFFPHTSLMERVEEGSTDVGSSWEGGGKLIPVESPGIGSSQVAVLEDAQTLEFSDVFINSWELSVSAEEIIAEIFLEILDIASFAALLVCLSEALALLRISSGFETGVVVP